MEIQIAIWTPDETHSLVRSWQPILMIIIILYIKKRRESGRGRVGQRWLHELCGGGEGVGGFGCRCGCSNLFLILMLASTGTKLKVLSFFGPP